MELQRSLPEQLAGLRGGLLVVEAERGRARKEVLEEWAERLRAGGQEPLLLRCDFRDAGVWGGVAPWVRGLLPAIERELPELAEKHAIELAMVLARAPHENAAPVTLTDQAAGGEAVRNYALDRAYRVPHGLVDLLDAWYAHAPPAPRVVVCDGYDRAGALSRHFFRELLRRRGEKLGITLVVVVSPGAGEEVRGTFASGIPLAEVRLELPADPPGMSPASVAFARVVEEGARKKKGSLPEHRFPELLRYWEEAGGPETALPWMAYALGRFNHYGFYEDALLFLEPVHQGIDRIPEHRDYLTRWNVVGAIYNCLVAVGQVERAYRVVEEEAVGKLSDPLDRARACYVMSMVHARFLPEKDYETAERYLREGMRELEAAPHDENRAFLHVFLGNGLALVRSRQGKPAEAIELCVTGLDEMRIRLESQKHRLHRSVLLYNIAQVHTATRDHEKAIEYFTAAMEMDPNYSEYHNERGNALFALGRYEEAVRDYVEAIRVSAPYQEAWTNLGQCYRRMGRLEDAAAAYARALDLDPSVEVARAGRAQVLAALGRRGEAIADYEAVLKVAEKERHGILANLAGLLYGEGRVQEALDRLDEAVALEPEVAPLYRNRAVALEALGRPDEAARDLNAYLALVPAAPDRAAVEEKIASLAGSLAAV